MNKYVMTLEEAVKRDKLIKDLAFYDVTKGMTIMDFQDEEEMISKQRQICQKYNIFKSQIQKGEYTLEELEDDIVSRNAAILLPEKGRSIDEVDNFVSEKEKEIMVERKDKNYDIASEIVKSLFPSGMITIPFKQIENENDKNEEDNGENDGTNDGTKQI